MNTESEGQGKVVKAKAVRLEEKEILVCLCENGEMISSSIAESGIDLATNPEIKWMSQEGTTVTTYHISTKDPYIEIIKGKRKAPHFAWKLMMLDGVTFDPTKFFLAEYIPQHHLYNEGKIANKSIIWQDLYTKFEKKGILLDEEQLANKLKSLTRTFQEHTKHQTKTGRARKPFAYEKEMGEILKEKDNCDPPFTYSSTSGAGGREFVAQQQQQSMQSSSSSASTTPCSTPDPTNALMRDEELEELAMGNNDNVEEKPEDEPKKKLGVTAKKVSVLTDTVKNIGEGIAQRAADKKQMQERAIDLQEQEVAERKKFCEDILQLKKDKLDLLRELFGKKDDKPKENPPK